MKCRKKQDASSYFVLLFIASFFASFFILLFPTTQKAYADNHLIFNTCTIERLPYRWVSVDAYLNLIYEHAISLSLKFQKGSTNQEVQELQELLIRLKKEKNSIPIRGGFLSESGNKELPRLLSFFTTEGHIHGENLEVEMMALLNSAFEMPFLENPLWLALEIHVLDQKIPLLLMLTFDEDMKSKEKKIIPFDRFSSEKQNYWKTFIKAIDNPDLNWNMSQTNKIVKNNLLVAKPKHKVSELALHLKGKSTRHLLLRFLEQKKPSYTIKIIDTSHKDAFESQQAYKNIEKYFAIPTQHILDKDSLYHLCRIIYSNSSMAPMCETAKNDFLLKLIKVSHVIFIKNILSKNDELTKNITGKTMRIDINASYFKEKILEAEKKTLRSNRLEIGQETLSGHQIGADVNGMTWIQERKTHLNKEISLAIGEEAYAGEDTRNRLNSNTTKYLSWSQQKLTFTANTEECLMVEPLSISKDTKNTILFICTSLNNRQISESWHYISDVMVSRNDIHIPLHHKNELSFTYPLRGNKKMLHFLKSLARTLQFSREKNNGVDDVVDAKKPFLPVVEDFLTLRNQEKNPLGLPEELEEIGFFPGAIIEDVEYVTTEKK